MNTIKSYQITKYKQGELEKTEDTLVVEYLLTIFLNKKKFITMLCTPKSLEELVIGFMFSEGIIKDKNDISQISIDNQNGKAHVELKENDIFSYIGDDLFSQKIITTACGKGKAISFPMLDFFKPVERPLKLNYPDVLKLINDFSRKSELFINTGGVHSCALSSQNEILFFEDDIGRHNALDKILGKAFLEDMELEDKIVLTTGRISSEILMKLAKRKIPVLVSRSAPTDKAVDMARELNITLIGFARGLKMNIYT